MSITFDNLASRLRELRESQNLLQKQLASKLDVNINTIQNCESGTSDPSLHTLHQYKEYFGISYDELLEGEQPLMDTQLLCLTTKLSSEQKECLYRLIHSFCPEDHPQ